MARYEPDTNKLFLLPKPLKEWSADHQLNYTAFTNELKDKLGARRAKIRITKGTKMAMPAVWVLELTFKLDIVDEGSKD